MRLAIHQPEYFPVPRLLAKWASADLLLLLDDVDFDRASCQHRAKLVSGGDGERRWLTVPYRHEGEVQRICDLRTAEPRWAEAHWWRVKAWYRGAVPSALDGTETWFRSMQVRESRELVSRVSEASMTYLADLISLTVPVNRTSEISVPEGGWGAGTARLVELCRAVGADAYLSGETSAGTYLDRDAFAAAGIRVEVQSFQPPVKEELSALHVLLRGGVDALSAQVFSGASRKEVGP